MTTNDMPRHTLTFRRPAPGTTRIGDTWTLPWTGTAVMGIVNVTPDSFSDGGRHASVDAAVRHARALRDAGALIVDIGGESTRPGARPVAEYDELTRVLPVIEALARDGNVVISVDTLKPRVAREALRAGAHIVNDVTGLRDPDMLQACVEHGAPAIIMHMQGEPRTMQRAPHYADVTREVKAFLHERARVATAAGVPSVMIDPGVGFGKTVEHNLTLLRDLSAFHELGHPILVGASRKRLIDALAHAPDADARDAGSIALHLHAAAQGAAMVRVHDVAGHTQALRVWAALSGPRNPGGITS